MRFEVICLASALNLLLHLAKIQDPMVEERRGKRDGEGVVERGSGKRENELDKERKREMGGNDKGRHVSMHLNPQ